MKDEKIFKIATITAVIGIVALCLTSGFITPEKLSIDKIDNSKLDHQVEITAKVESSITTQSGMKIIKLEDDTSTINLVIFPNIKPETPIYNNTNITVTAKVTRYDNQLELILENPENYKITPV